MTNPTSDPRPSAEALEAARVALADYYESLKTGRSGNQAALINDIAYALDDFAQAAVERERERTLYAVRQFPDGQCWVDWSPTMAAALEAVSDDGRYADRAIEITEELFEALNDEDGN